jgi:hypothetical protein
MDIDMSNKLKKRVNSFFEKVNDYMYMEYDHKYYKIATRDRNLVRVFDFITAQYLGGNNVPDTAGYLVEYINKYITELK